MPNKVLKLLLEWAAGVENEITHKRDFASVSLGRFPSTRLFPAHASSLHTAPAPLTDCRRQVQLSLPKFPLGLLTLKAHY